jgi:outer membrane lipoprotein-sorting protein
VLILNDFEFIQKTEMNTSITESKGNLYRNDNDIQIEIIEPSKELYKIKENKIEIYDYDFNQTTIYQIDENDGHLLDYIINGVNEAEVKDVTNNTFIIKRNDNDIIVEVKKGEGFSLTFIDNMQLKNIINFKLIK